MWPEFLNSNEIWYVEINQTLGYGEVPFLQMAFTLSFRNGVLYANNNLVGFGSNGNGFGVPVGNYLVNNANLQISHVIDGIYDFEVYQTGPNQMELYDPFSETSYFLTGYQRHNFDYDYLFFDNFLIKLIGIKSRGVVNYAKHGFLLKVSSPDLF